MEIILDLAILIGWFALGIIAVYGLVELSRSGKYRK